MLVGWATLRTIAAIGWAMAALASTLLLSATSTLLLLATAAALSWVLL